MGNLPKSSKIYSLTEYYQLLFSPQFVLLSYLNRIIKDHRCENVYFNCHVHWKEWYHYHFFTHNSISWTLTAPNHDVTILPISISMMITILPLTDVGWTGRGANTLDDTIAAYHVAKTPGAVPISGQFSTPMVLAVDWCPIVHLSSRLIGARCQIGCSCCCCSADLDGSAAT